MNYDLIKNISVSKKSGRNTKTSKKFNKKARALLSRRQKIARGEGAPARKAPSYQGERLIYQEATLNTKPTLQIIRPF
ncbi:hypothetical protein ACI2JA_12980 [Alkalihalobacillus sp. NPDC078783]